MTGYQIQSTVGDADSDVVLEIAAALATITLQRPSKINAMRLSGWRLLQRHIMTADADPAVQVIVIRGLGKHFSAGNDIAALSVFPGNPAHALEFVTAWAVAIEAVADAAKPVVMAIEGVCYGAALALTLAGDVRLASANATFSIPVAKLGALYLRSDYQRLVATIGMGQSKKLIYSSASICAGRALDIGLVDEVFSDDQFGAALADFAHTILDRSPFSLRRSKAMLRACGQRSVDRESSASLAEVAEATQCDDFAEGIAAFLGRRPARFVGV